MGAGGEILDHARIDRHDSPVFLLFVELDSYNWHASAEERGGMAAEDEHEIPTVPSEDGVHVSTVGGDSLLFVLAAAPFVQAAVAHFGTKLAGAIDETTRAAVHRFLLREVRDREARHGLPYASLVLRTERGWRLHVDAYWPAEALGQLLAIDSATPPNLADDPAPRLTWDDGSWRVTGVNDGEIVVHVWNVKTTSWDSPASGLNAP
ncbi:hypothetical protein ACIHCV_42785 [Streptomyces sp. NPDC051956]|uniref:hypothetical protein n=1 Tax=Streptomyces sp. NPDC051956 TaxID=3365677 RepID=UPI0037D96766